MRLPLAVIRVLTDDHNFNFLKCGRVERVENFRILRIDGASGGLLSLQKLFQRAIVAITSIEFAL